MNNPWYRPFNVQRVVEVNNDNELANALNNPQPFDHIKINYPFAMWLIVDKPNLMVSGQFERATLRPPAINSRIVNGITSGIPGNIIEMQGDDQAVINSVIQGDGVTLGSVGILSTAGKNQLTYGNVIRGTQHGVYIQNNANDGIEYVVHNYIGDVIPSNNSRTIHAYAESANKTELMYFIQNVVANGQALIGGQANATMPLYNLFQENWFSHADLNIGYKRPACTDLIGNYFLHSTLMNEWFYGVGDELGDTSVVTANKMYNPGGKQFMFRTAAYVNGVRQEGLPRIRSSDLWDNQDYFGPFHCSFNADGVNHVDVTRLVDWQEYTRVAGKQFDFSAMDHGSGSVPPDQYWLIPNDYDADRAMLVVWGDVDVQLPRPADVYGVDGILWSGTIPTIDDELTTFIVKYTSEPVDPCEDLKGAVLSICDDETISHQKRVRRIRRVVS